MATDETREMDDVARHLARTRAQLDRTLDELGRRLDPEHLRSEAKSYVRDRFARARAKATAFTSDHAVASLGALAALTALATLARRHRAHARDLEDAVRALLEANGFDANGARAELAHPHGSGGRRIAMLAAFGLGAGMMALGRASTSRPDQRPAH